MRNIVQLAANIRKGAVAGVDSVRPSIAIDSDNHLLYSVTSDSKIVAYSISITNQSGIVKEINLKALGHLKDDEHVVDMYYRMDDMSLWVCLSNCDIISIGVNGQIENVGSIQEGIEAMSWSPDGEILAIFSSAVGDNSATIYLLVCRDNELEFLAEFPFTTAEFGEAEFVTVGWGKKETQFHGSEGKQAATKKEMVKLTVTETDDRKPRIRWIGDGRFFAVSAIDSAVGARKIRVYTREGILHSTSECMTGLEHALDWRPSGNLIVSSQTHKNKHDIVFFERNGLRHGEFTLPFPVATVTVKEVRWNSESSILCVWLHHLQTSDTLVQLWTMNNYYWYLKQNYHYKASVPYPIAVRWDELDATTLHILLSDGSYSRHTECWVTCANTFSSSDHEVAVIDGGRLMITPFRSMIVPPPMCSYSIKFSSSPGAAITAILMSSFSQYSNRLAVLLSDATLSIITMSSEMEANSSKEESIDGLCVEAAGGTSFSIKCSTPQARIDMTLPEELHNSLLTLRHLVWLSADRLAIVRCDTNGQNILSVCQLQNDEVMSVTLLQETLVDNIYTLCPGPRDGELIVEYNDGSLWLYRDGDLRMYEDKNGSVISFPVPCVQISMCTFAGQPTVVGLSQRYRLFVNSIELASNCTSFAVHQHFLLLTTHTHTIRCINRATPLNKLASLSDGKTHIFDETVRRVERGSRIVTCVADDTKVILQMPRGNLELIHPRALVLSTVRKHLDRLKFKEAFLLMHRHRINMNLLCDHNRRAYLDNTRLFIEQLESVTHLNQFLTDLHEEDVTKTMYTAFYEQNSRDASTANSGGQSGLTKVDSVCNRMIESLQSIDSDKYLLTILTAHVRKTDPELEVALNVIKSLQETDRSRADEALKYLMFLVDVNELFDIALGMYDFQLVLLVAERSQKDPKEYLPFLNEVRKLDPDYQRFTIDKYLKRYKKALKHLTKCLPEKFVEFLSLVKDQKLFLEALNLLPNQSQEKIEVQIAFGDYLKDKKRFEEAGLLFMQTHQYKQALDCFMEEGSWQSAVVCAQKLGLHKTELLETYKRLADKLVGRRQYREASVVYDVYSTQPEEAITTLISGSLWEESMRLIHKYGRLDFIETDWKPAVDSGREQLMSNLNADTQELLAYQARFLAVQKEMKAKADLIGDEFRDVDADLYSDTSSMTGVSAVSSSHSRSTGRTSKNQRKAQRKKWSLKEGSKHEDLALLDEMKKLISRIDSMRGEVRSLLLALVKIDELEKAAELQNVFYQTQAAVLRLIPETWSSDVVNSAVQLTGEMSTVNSMLDAMSKLSTGFQANPAATEAEVEVKRMPVFSSETTWKLTMLS